MYLNTAIINGFLNVNHLLSNIKYIILELKKM